MTTRLSFGRGLALGALTVAGLTAIKLALPDMLGYPTPFLLYFGAALVGAWFGGPSAGVATTVIAAVTGNLVFLRAHSASVDALIGTGMYIIEGTTITAITSWLRSARRATTTTLDQLEAVLAGINDGITMLDASGSLIYVNDVGARMSGFASAREMRATLVGSIARRFELRHEDGTPMPAEELPSRKVLRSGGTAEAIVRFAAPGTVDEHWSLVRSNAVLGPAGELRFVVNVFVDITETRRSDEALRTSREWFETALRSIGDAVITTDRDGKVSSLNPVAEQLTGWFSAEAAGRPLAEVFRIFRETTREPVDSPVERVLREGKVVGLANHTVLISRDGSEHAIDDSAAPIRTTSGALVGVVLVFRDVTEQRRKDVRKAFLMRATAELNSSLDYETTLATVARLAVPAFADWCAVDMRDGDTVRRLAVAHVDPSKIELVQDIERRYPSDPTAPRGVHHILRTGEPELMPEIPAALLDASARDDEHRRLIHQLALHSYIGVPIKHGTDAAGVITFVTAESLRRYDRADLEFANALGERAAVAIENAALYRETERLRRDAAAQRDRLHAMIMAAPAAICLLRRDPDLRFELMNEPYRLRLASPLADGVPVSQVNLDATNVAMLERVFDTGQPEVGNEVPVHADYADGRSTHYLSYSVQPLRDAAGAVDRVVVFANDVTDQVVARQRVEAARAEAEQANRAKDEFLAMLGHELRNPLAPIVSALELMATRASGQLQRERSIIERQVKHMVRLVDDLLDISRVTRGKIDLARELVDLADVVAKAAEMSSPLVEERQHELVIGVPAGMIVDGDPTRLAQLLANLIQNAAKYTPKGGRIEIRGERAAGQLAIHVRDNGIGMSSDILPRVFDLFVQERQSLDRAQGGLGIGLAIVRNLVGLHGGSVEARSEGSGRGSELIVRLPPATGTPRATLLERPEMAAVDVIHERVLVVDDNSDALALLTVSLEMLGYQTLCATDGPSALVVAERERPRIAILDIGLPMMDGYELARRLRETPGLERIRLIALTGYGLASDRERSAAVGFDEHLVKPVTVEAVKAALTRLAPR